MVVLKPSVPYHSEGSLQDVVTVAASPESPKQSGFWHGSYIRCLVSVYDMLSVDTLVPEHSASIMIILQTLASYFSQQLDPKAATYLRSLTEAHLTRYGPAAFATRRSFLNLFRFYWSMKSLNEAKSLADNMAHRLRSNFSVAPDGYLIWETLAADVECRQDDRKALTLYGGLAEQYGQFPGPSNRSYEFLHRALHTFYTAKPSWGEEALAQIASAIAWLDCMPKDLDNDTETPMERRLAILALKATVLETLGSTDKAIRVYSDIMTTCTQSLPGDMYIESWHQVADNQITILKLAQSQQASPSNEEKITATAATVSAPVSMKEPHRTRKSALGESEKVSEGSNITSFRPVGDSRQPLSLNSTSTSTREVLGEPDGDLSPKFEWDPGYYPEQFTSDEDPALRRNLRSPRYPAQARFEQYARLMEPRHEQEQRKLANNMQENPAPAACVPASVAEAVAMTTAETARRILSEDMDTLLAYEEALSRNRNEPLEPLKPATKPAAEHVHAPVGLELKRGITGTIHPAAEDNSDDSDDGPEINLSRKKQRHDEEEKRPLAIRSRKVGSPFIQPHSPPPRVSEEQCFVHKEASEHQQQQQHTQTPSGMGFTSEFAVDSCWATQLPTMTAYESPLGSRPAPSPDEWVLCASSRYVSDDSERDRVRFEIELDSDWVALFP